MYVHVVTPDSLKISCSFYVRLCKNVRNKKNKKGRFGSKSGYSVKNLSYLYYETLLKEGKKKDLPNLHNFLLGVQISRLLHSLRFSSTSHAPISACSDILCKFPKVQVLFSPREFNMWWVGSPRLKGKRKKDGLIS